MPELAEVEFYRKQWNGGLRQKILSVHLNAKKRIFRGVNIKWLQKTLTGATLLESKAHGKQMLFRFSKNGWLGIHLGMTGKLRAAAALYDRRSKKMRRSQTAATEFIPAKHDHLVLFQKNQALIFSD